MKKTILIGLIVTILCVGLVSAATYKWSGYTGYVKEAMEGDANFDSNWGVAGHVPLPGSGPTTLTKTTQKDTAPPKYTKQKQAYSKPVRSSTTTVSGECTNGEYRLTDMKDGKYFGAEKCSYGRWRSV